MSTLTDGRLGNFTRAEQGVVGFVTGLVLLLLFGLVTGGLGPTYFLYLLGLVGMYVLLSFGLNVQWGYTGLINFSVAAFWGIGMYSVALLASPQSPLGLALGPGVALVGAVVVSAAVAVVIGVPTLRLRADYLAIASLGLAEIIRLLIQNQEGVTAGTRGVTIPRLLPGLVAFLDGVFAPDAGTFPYRALVNLGLVAVGVLVVYLLLRRVQRSPWGRVLRTIRSDEDLASALGKDTFSFKMQAFVIGSVLMALSGFFYAYQNLYVAPGQLEPIVTFYVWIAVILGGTGSNRGAILGGLVIVTIREGSRFLNDAGLLLVDAAAFRLLLIGVLIVLVVRYRPEGILPPRRELVWPGARDAERAPSGQAAADGGDGGDA